MKKQYVYHVYSDYGMKIPHPVEFKTKREAQKYLRECGCYTKDSEVWIEKEEVHNGGDLNALEMLEHENA